VCVCVCECVCVCVRVHRMQGNRWIHVLNSLIKIFLLWNMDKSCLLSFKENNFHMNTFQF